MGFYDDLKRDYGQEAHECLKKWRRLVVQLARLSCRRIFLLKCRSRGLVPKHISDYVNSVHDLVVRDSPFHAEMNRVLRRFKKSTLNIEIKTTVWTITAVTRQKDSCLQYAFEVLPEDVVRNYIGFMNNLREGEFLKNKYSLDRKFKSLQLAEGQGFFDYSGELAVTNLSDVDIPKDSLHLLSLGHKFAIEAKSKKDIPTLEIISDLEKVFSSVEINNTDVIRSACVNVVSNHLHRIDNAPASVSRQEPKIKDCYRKTQRFLKNHSEIVVCKSDKSSNTVIMKREDYDKKMEELLTDRDTYSKLGRDPSNSYRNRVNKVVDDLLVLKRIDYRTASSLKSFNGVVPKIYGLPKLHKPNIPMRPIVSFVNSPTYALSRFIEQFLQEIVSDSEYNVKDSFEFATAVTEQVMDDNLVMLSLDVKSLFTNIPLDIAFKLVGQHWDRVSRRADIPKQLFLSVLDLICEARYFAFSGNIYLQRFGLPMGSPISPILANIVMHDLLKSCLSLLGINVLFIKLYVDDLFLIARKGEEQNILDNFNSYHPRLQFTMELEENKTLPFLDVEVIRDVDGRLLTNWYRKPTSSGRILNYNSSHIMSQKVNCVKNMVKKIIDVSSPCFLVANKHKVKEILSKNGYPLGLIDKYWNDYLQLKNNPVDVAERIHLRYFRFPFVEGLSYKIRKIFKRELPDVALAFYNKERVGNLFTNLKDKIPIGLQSNVVYSLQCKDCNGVYYGETSRFLKERSYQHEYSIRMNRSTSTALASHAIAEKHQFDFPGIKVIAKEADEQRRRTLEMLFIKKDSSSINFRSDIDNLSNIYSSIV